jgi:hypothetical protein
VGTSLKFWLVSTKTTKMSPAKKQGCQRQILAGKFGKFCQPKN